MLTHLALFLCRGPSCLCRGCKWREKEEWQIHENLMWGATRPCRAPCIEPHLDVCCTLSPLVFAFLSSPHLLSLLCLSRVPLCYIMLHYSRLFLGSRFSSCAVILSVTVLGRYVPTGSSTFPSPSCWVKSPSGRCVCRTAAYRPSGRS